MFARVSWMFTAPALGLAATLGVACSEESTNSNNDRNGTSSGVTPTGDGGTTSTPPLYAMMIQVYGAEDRTVYVALSNTLDVTSVSLESAREFPGVANFAAMNDKLYISSGTEPKITEFTIGQDNSWTEGRSVSFAAYALEDNANFYYQFIADGNNAILPYQGTKRIHWDPVAMEIKGELVDTTLAGSEAGLTLNPGGNRNSVTFDTNSSILQAFFYADTDYFSFGTKSHVIAYNPGTFTQKSVIDVPCPGLSIATRDEQGTTYFGNWGLPSASIKGTAPATCVAKISPTGELLGTVDPKTWTNGRFVNNFRYVGNGKAFGNVLHHELLGVDSPSKLTDEQLSTIAGDGPQWKLWLFDVNGNTGVEVQGVDLVISSGAQMATIEGRTFLFVPYEKYGKTRAYELSADGKATAKFDTTGDIFKWVKVR